MGRCFGGILKISIHFKACLSAIVIALNDHKPVLLEQGGMSTLEERREGRKEGVNDRLCFSFKKNKKQTHTHIGIFFMK